MSSLEYNNPPASGSECGQVRCCRPAHQPTGPLRRLSTVWMFTALRASSIVIPALTKDKTSLYFLSMSRRWWEQRRLRKQRRWQNREEDRELQLLERGQWGVVAVGG